jgi:hypothetical protein
MAAMLNGREVVRHAISTLYGGSGLVVGIDHRGGLGYFRSLTGAAEAAWYAGSAAPYRGAVAVLCVCACDRCDAHDEVRHVVVAECGQVLTCVRAESIQPARSEEAAA